MLTKKILEYYLALNIDSMCTGATLSLHSPTVIRGGANCCYSNFPHIPVISVQCAVGCCHL